jgi:nucleotide-binding universal stress UspA family protein
VLEQVREPLEADARKVAAQSAQRVSEAGFQAAVVVSHGHIGHRIVELAESTHADLVVVGSRGLTGMTRYLMGSVSDAVVKYAACPVLVFRR